VEEGSEDEVGEEADKGSEEQDDEFGSEDLVLEEGATDEEEEEGAVEGDEDGMSDEEDDEEEEPKANGECAPAQCLYWGMVRAGCSVAARRQAGCSNSGSNGA
jgi:hypothetical protein